MVGITLQKSKDNFSNGWEFLSKLRSRSERKRPDNEDGKEALAIFARSRGHVTLPEPR
jgi:hypothetical protein